MQEECRQCLMQALTGPLQMSLCRRTCWCPALVHHPQLPRTGNACRLCISWTHVAHVVRIVHPEIATACTTASSARCVSVHVMRIVHPGIATACSPQKCSCACSTHNPCSACGACTAASCTNCCRTSQQRGQLGLHRSCCLLL